MAREHAVWVVLAALEAAADGWAPTAIPPRRPACWAVIDAQRRLVPDRTYGSETGIYAASRERDRRALRPAIPRGGARARAVA